MKDYMLEHEQKIEMPVATVEGPLYALSGWALMGPIDPMG